MTETTDKIAEVLKEAMEVKKITPQNLIDNTGLGKQQVYGILKMTRTSKTNTNRNYTINSLITICKYIGFKEILKQYLKSLKQ